jgi:hypothetical protein
VSVDDKRQLLRHLVATVAFRARFAFEDAGAEFADFSAPGDVRTPLEILAHIGDLLIGSESLMRGEYIEIASSPLLWSDEIERFGHAVRALDDLLASDQALAYPAEKFVQGPVGDALTHVGQIVLLRRVAGAPVTKAPYFTAEIIPGEF